MGNNKKPQQLAKFLAYMLGRRPDEFGLFPDDAGFVKTKELLKAVWEEGWRHVRLAHLKEVLLVIPDAPIEISDTKIRAVNREHLAPRRLAEDVPKLLFTCVRRKAYPRVAQKGLMASAENPIRLAADKAMALRMGKRIDAEAVLLTVNTETAELSGALFFSAGAGLFTANRLDVQCISGPPLPKEKPPAATKAVPSVPESTPTPGSFFPDAGRTAARSTPSWAKNVVEQGGKGEKGPKGRKRKRTRERPPWRK